MTKNDGLSFMDKVTMYAAKIGGEVHLMTLRDSFATTMPLFILAGIGTLVNYVVFPAIFKGDTLAKVQTFGTILSNGTLNVCGLIIAPVIAFYLARHKKFENPLSCSVISIASLIVMMPINIDIIPNGADAAVNISGILTFNNLGTTGMFSGVIIGLVATELFMWVSGIKKLQVNLGDNIPPAVGASFSVLFPTLIVLSLFGIISTVLAVGFNTNLIDLIIAMIQEPLRRVNTSLVGTVFIYSFGNLLFFFGIHQSVVNSTILEPFLLQNTNDNMLAFANHEKIPHILNNVFVPTFGMIGGTGSTISLIIAILLVAKLKSNKQVASLAIAPGLFNINEPVIFGIPIVFNFSLLIPFIGMPAFGITLAYFCTKVGLISHTIALVPWTTPPLISAFLATGGDIRAVILQALIIATGVVVWIPFLKVSENVQLKQVELEAQGR